MFGCIHIYRSHCELFRTGTKAMEKKKIVVFQSFVKTLFIIRAHYYQRVVSEALIAEGSIPSAYGNLARCVYFNLYNDVC